MTLFLLLVAAIEAATIVTIITTRSTHKDVSNGALIVGALTAATLWAAWNGYSWYLRLRGQSEEQDIRTPPRATRESG